MWSRSLSGQRFTFDHHVLLRAVARGRGWKESVWVPEKTVQKLSLPLNSDVALPVSLHVHGGLSTRVYHVAQFEVPLPALREAWCKFVAEEAIRQQAGAAAAQLMPDNCPLNTHGERFDAATEERIQHCCHRAEDRSRSRYWTTAAEASFVFGSPFTDAYLADTSHAVETHACSLCRPVLLYNVEGTVDPSRFSPLTCRRYDPVNYAGSFYRPAVAVVMKAHAIRYDCLQERQWISVRRAHALGLAVPASVVPLRFSFEALIALVNVAQTSVMVDVSHASTPASDTKGFSNAVDGALERPLLV